MMDLDAYSQGFLREYAPFAGNGPAGDSLAAEGCIGLYGATGDGRFREEALRLLEKHGTENERGMVLLFALDETGEQRHEDAARALMRRLSPRDAAAPEELYAQLPFLMACQMRFDRMAHTGDVVEPFRRARQRLYQEETGLYGGTLREEGLVLMALADSAALCSRELYEHWRALVDLFREAVRGLMPYQRRDTGLFQTGTDGAPDRDGCAMAAYALLKGVRLGVLDPEKYGPAARKVLAGLAAHPDGTDAGALALAVAEYLRTARKSSEVKHDGAV